MCIHRQLLELYSMHIYKQYVTQFTMHMHRRNLTWQNTGCTHIQMYPLVTDSQSGPSNHHDLEWCLQNPGKIKNVCFCLGSAWKFQIFTSHIVMLVIIMLLNLRKNEHINLNCKCIFIKPMFVVFTGEQNILTFILKALLNPLAKKPPNGPMTDANSANITVWK